MFYVLIFSILAVVLIVGGLGAWSRSRRRYEDDEVAHATQTTHTAQAHAHDGANRRSTKAKRAQSRHDRRKR